MKGIVTLALLVAILLSLSAGAKNLDKLGILKYTQRQVEVHTILLHHTAGPSVKSAENALKNRGLSYHYIIDRNGDVYLYVDPRFKAFHALGANAGTIGISFVGGGKYGIATEAQLDKLVDLCYTLKQRFKNLKYLKGHRDISPKRKIDPDLGGNYKKRLEELKLKTELR